MNRDVIKQEIDYAVSLLKNAFTLIRLRNEEPNLEAPVLFCLYNGIEKLLKISIGIKKFNQGEVAIEKSGDEIIVKIGNKTIEEYFKKMGHGIEKLYKEFTGKEIASHKGFSASEIKKEEFYLNGSRALLDELNEFASASSRYKNINNMFSPDAKPFIYGEKYRTNNVGVPTLMQYVNQCNQDGMFPPTQDFQKNFINREIENLLSILVNIKKEICSNFLHDCEIISYNAEQKRFNSKESIEEHENNYQVFEMYYSFFVFMETEKSHFSPPSY